MREPRYEVRATPWAGAREVTAAFRSRRHARRFAQARYLAGWAVQVWDQRRDRPVNAF